MKAGLIVSLDEVNMANRLTLHQTSSRLHDFLESSFACHPIKQTGFLLTILFF